MKKFLKLFYVLIFVVLTSACTNKEKITYSVTFDSNGGNVLAGQEVKKNGTVERPVDPVKEGYKFIGWQRNYVNYNFNEKVNKNIKLVAKWEKVDSETSQPVKEENKVPNTDQGKKDTNKDKNVNNKPNKKEDNKNDIIDNISVSAKNKNYTFNVGTSKEIKDLFNFNYGKTTGTITCTQNGKVIYNIKTLSAGKYSVICTLKSQDGRIAKDITNIEIINNNKNNFKTETIKFNSTSSTQTKTITVENLDSIVDYKVNTGSVAVSKDGNKIKLTVNGNKNPKCSHNSGHYETLFYRDGSTCSTYYLYTYVNGIITDLKCVEISCKQSVYDKTTHKTTLYPDDKYNTNCKCPSSADLKGMVGYNTNTNWNETKKIDYGSHVCVYTKQGKWISPSTTCNYEYIVTITYKLK